MRYRVGVFSKTTQYSFFTAHGTPYFHSLLRRSPIAASCWLSHCFEYTRESAREEGKGPLPNNVCESAFQRTNRVILSSANFCTIYQVRHFSLKRKCILCSGNR